VAFQGSSIIRTQEDDDDDDDDDEEQLYVLLFHGCERLPGHQEEAEAGEQEGDEHPDPHLNGEGRQEAQVLLLEGPVLTQQEAEARLHEGRGHLHRQLSGRCDGQWSHSQVCFLVCQKEKCTWITGHETLALPLEGTVLSQILTPRITSPIMPDHVPLESRAP